MNRAKTAQTLSRVGDNLSRSDHSLIYYAIFTRGGKQIRRSLWTTDRALAIRGLEEKRRRVAGRHSPRTTAAQEVQQGADNQTSVRRPSSLWRELVAKALEEAPPLFRQIRGIAWKIMPPMHETNS